MIETWRWFGPTDRVTLSDIRQTGASGIVTSLYHLEPGIVWKKEEISSRLKEIGRAHVRTPVTSQSRMPSSA